MEFVLVVVLELVIRPSYNSDFEDEHKDEVEMYHFTSQVYALHRQLLNLEPCRINETSVSFSIKLAAFQAGGLAEL